MSRTAVESGGPPKRGIGLLAVENPELTIQEIKDILEAKAEYEEGRTTELDPRAV